MSKLTKCRTCGQPIADEAKICPHCGAKNKKGISCCSGVILIVLFFVISAAISMRNTVSSIQEKNASSPSSITIPEELFAEIKNDPAVEKVEITGNKIKVIYKKDLPEMCYLEMRKLAQRGTKHTGRPYSAECSVSAAPDKVLYFETRDGNMTTAIAFTRNTLASDTKAEDARLAEAARQKKISQEKIKAGIAYSKFESQFVSKWDGSCRPVVETVKKNMKDPKSFEHIKTKVFTTDTDNFLIEMRFRGNNSFGALVVNTVTATVTPQGQVISIQ